MEGKDGTVEMAVFSYMREGQITIQASLPSYTVFYYGCCFCRGEHKCFCCLFFFFVKDKNLFAGRISSCCNKACSFQVQPCEHTVRFTAGSPFILDFMRFSFCLFISLWLGYKYKQGTLIVRSPGEMCVAKLECSS